MISHIKTKSGNLRWSQKRKEKCLYVHVTIYRPKETIITSKYTCLGIRRLGFLKGTFRISRSIIRGAIYVCHCNSKLKRALKA